MATKTPKDHTLVARAQLTRILEAVARIEYPHDDERAFRVGIMKRLQLYVDLPKADDAAMQERALDIRDLESSCAIKRPNPDERAFRLMTMSRLAAAFRLAELRRVPLAK